VTEPVLALEIGGEEFSFMVDTGAMVSLIQPDISKAQVQPCDVQARGITGTQLDIIGEQKVKFVLQSDKGKKVFKHTFVVSPLGRCSSGILGMDFLQRVGAEISLTSQSLNIGHHSFPLRGQEPEVVQRLINAERKGTQSPDQEERDDESVEYWEGTVELAETVTVPPLSVRIARCRVVRRDGLDGCKVPQKQVVYIDPEGTPGVYMARIVATLNECSERSLRMPAVAVCGEPTTRGQKEKSSLVKSVFPPPSEIVEKQIGHEDRSSDNCVLETGAGECLSELPEGGLLDTTTDRRTDLQCEYSSRPVENILGNQIDTVNKIAAQGQQGRQGQVKEKKINKQVSTNTQKRNIQRRPQVLGYVPLQIVNMSLEEVEIAKQTPVGVASPIQIESTQVIEGCHVHVVQSETDVKQKFEEYIQGKLSHLKRKDRDILENVLWQYKHLFYGIENKELGCTSQVEHSIDTGDAKPIRKNPYRIPHALKPVVEEHIDEMLEKKNNRTKYVALEQ